MTGTNSFSSLLQKHGNEIQTLWIKQLADALSSSGKGRISVEELRIQATQFLSLLTTAIKGEQFENITGTDWAEVRSFLDELSQRRALAGFTSDETATFIFSLKRAVFDFIKQDIKDDPKQLMQDVWVVTTMLDNLGLYTVKSYQKTREEIINRQQEELLELSTPVVKLWDGILALPMIGTLDSARTQVVMESLLQRIVETESELAIIDITGVPNVDTLVAQHLLKTVTAIRLMGADCIISGMRPQIAQTIVHLGVDLQGTTTKANLADALNLALKRVGYQFVKQ